MVKVPGSESSLERERAAGADIRVVYSPLDALRMENLLPHGSPGARARVTPAEVRENLRDFVRAARQQGATAVLVAPAHGAPRVASEPWLSAAEDEVVTAAGDTGALLADARSAFVALSPYPLFSDTIHYVPLGQQLVALSVTAAMLEQPAALALGAERARWLEQYRSARDCTGLWPGRTAPPEFPRNLPPCAQEGLFGPGAPPALLLALDATRNQPLQPARARLAAAATRSADALTPDPLLAWIGAAEVSDDETLRAALALVHFEERAGLALPQIPRAFAEGLAAARAGRPELALPRLEAALGAEPELVAAHFERAWLLRRAGRRDEAVRAFEQVAALDPQGALGLCVTGLFALEAGDAAGAESALRAALARDGGSGHARWLLARALLARDALPEARREAETARLLLPGELDVSGLLQRIDERAAEIDGAPR